MIIIEVLDIIAVRRHPIIVVAGAEGDTPDHAVIHHVSNFNESNNKKIVEGSYSNFKITL